MRVIGAPAVIAAAPIEAGAAALAYAKAYLRLDADAEDALLARLLDAALAHGEAFTGQTLLARGVSETVPASPEWRRLVATPVTAITGMTGLAPLGTAVALAADAYALDIDASGDGWVRVIAPGAATRATVSYTAGLAGEWGGLPEAVRQGAVRLAAHFFTNRDSAEEGAPPAAVAALWRPWRRMRLT